MVDERRRNDPIEMISRQMDRQHTEVRADIGEIRKDVTAVRIQVAKLQVKAGVWGAIAGLVSAGVALCGVLLKSTLSGGGK